MLHRSSRSAACQLLAGSRATSTLANTSTAISSQRTQLQTNRQHARQFHSIGRLTFNTRTHQRITALHTPLHSTAARTMASYPDHTVLKMPALSPTMEKGNLVSWNKQIGEEIKPGEVMAEVETDKATVAFESVEEGYLAKILIEAGASDVAVGTPVAVVVEDKGDVDAFKDFSVDEGSADPNEAAVGGHKVEDKDTAKAEERREADEKKTGQPQPKPSKQQESQPKQQSSSSSSSGDRVKASPYAKKLAAEQGIDLAQIRGTGPEGRIVEADIQEQGQAAKSSGKPAEQEAAPSASSGKEASGAPLPPGKPLQGDYTDIKNSNVRKTIATRLLQSKQQVPHYYLTSKLRMDKVLALRQELNAQLAAAGGKDGKPVKLSVNDLIVKAAALALRKVPAVNTSWTEASIRQYNYVDISVAVATEGGLITPIIKDADKKGLASISTETKDLARRARDGKLQPQEYQGGTFTISNLGMYGIEHFTAIINPPQSAIMAVGATTEEVVVDRDATILPTAEPKFKVVQVMNVTLSCDHRTVDGAVGSQYLQAFKQLIENPTSMLL